MFQNFTNLTDKCSPKTEKDIDRLFSCLGKTIIKIQTDQKLQT